MNFRTWLREQTNGLRLRVAHLKPPGVEHTSAPETDLTVSDVFVNHKFVFDTGRNWHPLAAAEALLEAGVASAAYRPATEEVFTPSRFDAVRQLGSQHAKLVEAAQAADRGLTRLALFLLRHPRTARLLLAGWRRRNDPQSDEPDPTNSTDADSPSDPGEFFEWADEQIRQQGLLAAIQSGAEEDIIVDAYLSEEQWLRLELETVICKRAENETAEIDVTLLLHRTGLVSVTFHVWHPGPLTPAEALEIHTPEHPQFIESKMPTELVRLAEREAGSTYKMREPDESTIEGGLNVGTWLHADEPISVRNIFEIYHAAILETVKGIGTPRAESYGGWRAVPIMAIRDPSRAFMGDTGEARIALASLVTRLPLSAVGDESMLTPFADRQLSTNNIVKIWGDAGSALLVHSPDRRQEMLAEHGSLDNIPGQDWIRVEQHLNGAYDLILMSEIAPQVAKLTADAAEPTRNGLRKATAEVLALESDLRGQNYFKVDLFRRLQRLLREQMEVDESWSRAHRSLELVIAEVERTAQAKAEAQHSRLQLLVGLLTLVAGVPALDQVVKALADLSDDDWVQRIGPIEWLTERAAEDPSLLQISLVFVLLLSLVIVRLTPFRRGGKPVARRSIETPPPRTPHVFSRDHRITIVNQPDPTEQPREADDGRHQ